jgi:hypothetical protein
VVVDRAGLQVVLGHAERLLDLEQPVVGADHEVGRDEGAVRAGLEVGDVTLDGPLCAPASAHILRAETANPQVTALR